MLALMQDKISVLSIRRQDIIPNEPGKDNAA